MSCHHEMLLNVTEALQGSQRAGRMSCQDRWLYAYRYRRGMRWPGSK